MARVVHFPLSQALARDAAFKQDGGDALGEAPLKAVGAGLGGGGVRHHSAHLSWTGASA